MLDGFSLSHKRELVLPTSVWQDEKEYPVNADFRQILRCFRLEKDPHVAQRHKVLLMCKAFYACPLEELPPDPLALLWDFVAAYAKDMEKVPGSAPMDYEYDADAIYASFLQQYGIDLLTVPFLHWYAFSALLEGLCEHTPLMDRLQTRGMDTKSLKGKDRQRAEAAKRNAQIKPKKTKASQEERAAQRELSAALKHGGDVTAVIQKLTREGR